MPVRIDAGAPNLTATFSDEVRVGGAGAIGAALAGASADLANIGLRLQRDRIEQEEKQQREADAVWLARTGADWRIRKAKELDEGLQSYDGSESGFAQGYLDRYKTEAADLVATAPERIRKSLELELIRQGDVMAGAALEGESTKRQAWTLDGITKAIDTEAEALVTTPDLYEDSLTNVPNIAAAAPAGIRAKVEKDARFKLGSAYAEGLLSRDPRRLVDELESGALDPAFEAAQKANWLRTAKAKVENNIATAHNGWERVRAGLQKTANDYTSRAIAFWNAGLSPPQDLIKAAIDANRNVSDEGNTEAMNLARYHASQVGIEATRTNAKDALGDLSDALKLGLTPSQELVDSAVSAVKASKAPDLARQLQDIIGLAGKQQTFAFMTPEQLSARRDELMATPATRETTQELQLLDSIESGRGKAIADRNLVGWAASNGVKLVPLQANDPNLADAVAARARSMAAVAKQTGSDFQLFGKNEGPVFARQLEQLPPDQRLKVLGTMAAVLGSDTGTVMQEISKTAPVDAQAGMLLLMDRRDAAAAVINGQAALKQTPALAPKRTAPEAIFAESSVIGRALPPELQQERNAIVGAAAAIYATEAQRGGIPDGEFNQDLWAKSLQRAGGREGDRGGFGIVNGLQLMLPPQLTQDDVDGLLWSGKVFGDDWFKYSYGDPSSGQAGGPPAYMDPATGQLRRLPASQLKEAKLVTVGQGLYQVSITDPAQGAQYVLDLDTGDPFILDLRDAPAGVR